MKSRIRIALAGYAGGESDLETLKNVVPNGDFTYFDGNKIEHSPNARRLNEQLNVESEPEPEEDKLGRKVKKARRNRKKVKAFGTRHEAESRRRPQPNGADMYYGLKPIEHNPVFHLSETANPALSSVTKIKISLSE